MERGKLQAGGPAPAVSYVYGILRSPDSYVQLPGRKEQSQQTPVTQRDKVSRKLTKQCCSEGTPGISSAPQNDNHRPSIQGEEMSSWDLKL